jgi:hypothetical protein
MTPAAGKKLIPLDGWDMASAVYLLWNSDPDDAPLPPHRRHCRRRRTSPCR